MVYGIKYHILKYYVNGRERTARAYEDKGETMKGKKDFKFFEESLKEGVKFAQGKPAKVKVETLRVRLTGAVIKEARHVLKVSQPQFARLMGVSPETVKKWEQGKNPVPAAVGYWAEGLMVHPTTTKNLLYEMAGKYSASETIEKNFGILKDAKGSMTKALLAARKLEREREDR
jgi:DNA-binding transcriptional regulator YiaG